MTEDPGEQDALILTTDPRVCAFQLHVLASVTRIDWFWWIRQEPHMMKPRDYPGGLVMVYRKPRAWHRAARNRGEDK